jgi:transitional endoplasmic reticulum ATPase
MESLVREAAMLALRQDLDAKEVSKNHFDEAMNKVRPSITKRDIEVYKKIEEKYLRSAKAAIEQSNTYLG